MKLGLSEWMAYLTIGIYSREGQKYQPEDADKVMWYQESKDGVMLEEGINEAGAFCMDCISNILC